MKKSDKEKIDRYMDSIRAAIRRDYVDIPGEWEPQLDMLRTYYELFLKAQAELSKQTLLVKDGTRMSKNQLITIINDCNVNMQRIVKKFGLSPYDHGHMVQRGQERLANTMDPDEQYLDNI